MKKLLFTSILICSTLFVYAQTRQEKATKLIKDHFFKTMYDFESYQPIETKIDSAYTSIYEDEAILKNVKLLDYMLEKTEEIKGTYVRIANTSAIAARDLKDKQKDGNKAMFEAADLVYNSLEADTQNFKKEFIGWRAVQKFRSKSRGGMWDISEYMFIFDKNLTKIVHHYDLKDLPKNQALIDKFLSGRYLIQLNMLKDFFDISYKSENKPDSLFGF